MFSLSPDRHWPARRGPPDRQVIPVASCWDRPPPCNIKAELSAFITGARPLKRIHQLPDTHDKVQIQTDTETHAANFILPAYLYCSVVLVADEGSGSHAPVHWMMEQGYQQQLYCTWNQLRDFIKVLLFLFT